jgi:hypothetical protein
VVLNDPGLNRTFMPQVVGKTWDQFNNYWRRLLFSGKGSAPTTFRDPAELLAFVERTPGAVGYVPDSDVPPSVKKLPLR